MSFDAFTLHIVAFVTMLIDHVGAMFFPNFPIFRIIGRIAFPIFAFFIAEGIKKTKNKKKYLLRMLFCAIISEIPYNYFLSGHLFFKNYVNVQWTYVIAICGIYLILKLNEIQEQIKPYQNSNSLNLAKIIIAILAILLACVVKSDYIGCGVLFVFIFFFIDPNTKYGKILQTICLFVSILIFYSRFTSSIMGINIPIEFFALFSLPLLWKYNGKQGVRNKITKIGFYSFYPIHLFVLRFMTRFI